MTMTAKSYLKVLGLAVLTVMAIVYLAMLAVAIWNTFAPADLCWIDYEESWRLGLLLFSGPFVVSAITFLLLENMPPRG